MSAPALVVLFEDDGVERLWPLAATRPVWELRLGGHTLAEKLRAHFPDTPIAHVGRPAVLAAADDAPLATLDDVKVPGGDVLWVNGRALADSRWLDALGADGNATPGAYRYLVDRRVLALRHPASLVPEVRKRPTLWANGAAPPEAGFEEMTLDATFVDELWDLLRYHHHELLVEGELAVRAAHAAELVPRDNPALSPVAHVIAGSATAIHPTARVGPGVVLDASDGPIVIERDAILEPLTYVVGPSWIGAGSHVLGGKLSGTTLGPVCRVAGEVEETIFLGYGNKRHHGFVGHSVVGAWVNLGALTTTSDLKNNYGSVRVRGRETGEPKIGSFLGDHVKTGIGTLLTTGAVVGPASNLFGGGTLSPKELPAFAWWDGQRTETYRLSAWLETARIVYRRRGRTFGEAEEQLYRTLASGERI